MLNIEKFTFNPFKESTYVLWDKTNEGVIIDPGCYDDGEFESLHHFIVDKDIVIKEIWLTHGHFDHIYGVKKLSELYEIPVRMCSKDLVLLEHAQDFVDKFHLQKPDTNFATIDIKDGDTLSFGETEFIVITTPGHSPGGVCYYDKADKILISGDTLFYGCIGRTDIAFAEYDKLIVSIMDKLMCLDADVKVYPGHSHSTEIGFERTHNPFLEPFNEPLEEMNWDIHE